MKQSDFEVVVNETVAAIQKLLLVKGGEYANSDDRLANFKRGAALTGSTPLQVAFIYASKHYDGIASFVRTSAAGTPRPSSEPIEGRFDDLINYCLLMKALVRESQPVAWKDCTFEKANSIFAASPLRINTSSKPSVATD